MGIVWSEILDSKSSALLPLVVSALIDEIPVTKIRDGERASPSAYTHLSEPLFKSIRQVVCDPFAFLTNTRAVGNALVVATWWWWP